LSHSALSLVPSSKHFQEVAHDLLFLLQLSPFVSSLKLNIYISLIADVCEECVLTRLENEQKALLQYSKAKLYIRKVASAKSEEAIEAPPSSPPQAEVRRILLHPLFYNNYTAIYLHLIKTIKF
jgi:hypothetical protein